MRALAAKITKGLTLGSELFCADNSGAKIVSIIGVKHWKGKRSRLMKAGIGDIVIVSVKKGNAKVRKTKQKAVIIRQRKEFRRGLIRVKFEDNACALIDDQRLPKGTEIKGAVAREIATSFPKVVGIASVVV